MADVRLLRNRRRRLEAGHPWVYRSEIESVRGEPATGDVVAVRNHQGHFLARGFYHAESQIAVRAATYDESERIDSGWLRRRVTRAWDFRKRFLAHPDACRAVYGEADGLPGLIVDKYGPVAVAQVLSAGLDRRREWLAPALRDVLGVEAVFERSDAHARSLEGLPAASGWLLGDGPEEVEILENGLRFAVDIAHGQKTGHFFDQRENRAALAPLVRWAADERPRPDQRFREGADGGAAPGRRGAEVLDCFAHTGAFSLHALRYGAWRATLVEISEPALARARRNLELNGLAARAELAAANAFDLLREYEANGRAFDVVILDPPAFAKHREAVESALRGYKEINLRALRIIRDRGFLVTASCSSPIDRETFLAVVGEAALDARRLLRRIEVRGAARDHPSLAGMPENDYLKFAVFEVSPR